MKIKKIYEEAAQGIGDQKSVISLPRRSLARRRVVGVSQASSLPIWQTRCPLERVEGLKMPELRAPFDS